MTWNYPPRIGGIEEMVAHLAARLRDHAEVTVLTAREPSARARVPGILRSPLPGLLGFLVWLSARLPAFAGRRDGLVVLSAGALVGSYVEVITRFLSIPHAMMAFGSDVTYPARIYQGWLRLILPSVPVLLPISAAVECELVKRGLVGRGGMTRMPPGVDSTMVDAPSDSEVVRPKAPVLLFVGRVIERKGLEPFIRFCLPRILARQPVELWVVGDEASASLAHRPGALGRIRELVAGSSVEARIRFFGAASDSTLRAAYRAASLLVLPAVPVEGDVEGFGIVFLEAALFGVPAVSTRLGGIPDAVIDGENGLLVEPGDWRAFADAVTALLGDEAMRLRLGEGARRRAMDEYDWRAISARCYQVLRTLRRD